MSEKQDKQSQVVLLYYVTCENETKAKQEIVKAISPYEKIQDEAIKLQNKDGKYSAYVRLEEKAGIIISYLSLKTLSGKINNYCWSNCTY